MSISALLTGCTKELPFDTKDVDSKIVVSCFLNEGEPIEMVLSKSFGLLSDTTGFRLEGATIELIYNNTFLTTFQDEGNGHYVTTLKAEKSGNYEIQVSHPLYPSVTGKDVVPEKPVITYVDSIPFVNGFPTIYLTLNDPIGPSYFAIKAFGYNKLLIRDSTTLNIIDSIPQAKALSVQSLDRIFDTDKDLSVRRLPFVTFTDQFFLGTKLEMSLRLLEEELDASFYQTRMDSVTVELRNISSAYYHFIKSYNRSKPIFGGPFESFEPIEGNINGGYGVIAGCSKVSFKIPVQW